MAGYRPKSLEELNSLYDKSLSAKNEIVKKASGFEEKAGEKTYIPAPVASKVEEESEKVREEAVTEQISGLVDDFIKSFGAPVAIKKVRPATAPTPVKAVAPVKAVEANVSEEKAPAQQVTPVASDKPNLIRNSERNDLFENYKKVMDDEDDYEYSRHKKLRKRGKKLFEKKNTAAETVQEEINEESAEAEFTETAEAPVVEEIPNEEADVEIVIADGEAMVQQDEDDVDYEDVEAVIEKVLGITHTQDSQEEEQIADAESEAAQEENLVSAEEDSDTEETDEAEATEEEELYQNTEEAAEQDYDDEFPVIPDDLYSAQEADEAYEIAEEAQEEEYYQEEEIPVSEETAEEEVISAPVAKKSYAVKNILLALLFVVLVFATAVSAVKAFAGINTDKVVFGKYHLYSAQSNYTQAEIKKGDLVLVVHEDVEVGEIFAYKNGDGDYAFAKLESVLNEESVVVDNDGFKSIVFKNTIRGVFSKAYPSIGTLASAVASYYIYIVGALMAVALVILLIIVFAFRKKKEDEEDEEYQQEVVYDEASYEEPAYEELDNDFEYLIDEGYDEAESQEYEEDAGMPVYQPLQGEADENYKYEPDEYVTE